MSNINWKLRKRYTWKQFLLEDSAKFPYKMTHRQLRELNRRNKISILQSKLRSKMRRLK